MPDEKKKTKYTKTIEHSISPEEKVLPKKKRYEKKTLKTCTQDAIHTIVFQKTEQQ